MSGEKLNNKEVTNNKKVAENFSNEGAVVVTTTAAAATEPPFWAEDPNIILSQKYVFDLFPVEKMSLNEKLNAITRTILLLTIIGFVYSKSFRLLIISAIMIFCIYLLHLYENRKIIEEKEGYSDPAEDLVAGNTKKNIEFDTPTVNNPFSNVLMTDYEDNPNKKPAPPTEDDIDNILEKTKEMIIKTNPGQPDIADKLFSDLGDNFNFEQSMRPFYSNANTEIPNDQNAFAEFCYGSMISCKEGNNFACARNLQRYTN